jgi:hypothetical protein
VSALVFAAGACHRFAVRGSRLFVTLLFLFSCQEQTLDLRSNARVAVGKAGASNADPAARDASHSPFDASVNGPRPPPVSSPDPPTSDAGESLAPGPGEPTWDGGRISCFGRGPNGEPTGILGCPNDWVCDWRTETCAPCTGDNDCVGRICEEETGSCVECGFEHECDRSKVCGNGICWDRCEFNSDCLEGNRCTPVRNDATQRCLPCDFDSPDPECWPCNNGECPFDLTCVLNRCERLDPDGPDSDDDSEPNSEPVYPVPPMSSTASSGGEGGAPSFSDQGSAGNASAGSSSTISEGPPPPPDAGLDASVNDRDDSPDPN